MVVVVVVKVPTRGGGWNATGALDCLERRGSGKSGLVCDMGVVVVMVMVMVVVPMGIRLWSLTAAHGCMSSIVVGPCNVFVFDL